MKSRSLLLLGVFLSAHLAEAGEVLLYTGPTATVEISSIASPTVTAEELVFVKQFFVDSEMLAKLPAPHWPSAPATLTADRAVALAKATVEAGAPPREITATKPELLRSTPAGTSHPVEYYFIELHVQEASEQRLVLMDGTVLKPRLKQIRAGK